MMQDSTDPLPRSSLQGGANPDAEFGGKTLLFRLCACDALPEAELLPQLALLLRAGASAATRFDRHEGRLMSPVLEVSALCCGVTDAESNKSDTCLLTGARDRTVEEPLHK